MLGGEFGFEPDVPFQHLTGGIQFGRRHRGEAAGLEVAHAFNQNVLAASGVDLFYVNQLHQSARGSGDVLKMEGDSKKVVFCSSACHGVLQFNHQLAVARLENVQARFLSWKQEDPKWEEGEMKGGLTHALR